MTVSFGTADVPGARTAGGDIAGQRGAAVVVQALTRRFGKLIAVDHAGFAVRPGELFGLVGPDGAGKTTLLRMLAGVLRPDEGDAVFRGISVVRDPEAVKHRIAYMSQRFGLYGDLTVLENLHFFADLYRVPRAERPARLERLFRFSNLGAFQTRLAGKLSGGMKQKLGLSCALIHEPEILLLDEPTFGVDPISRRDLWLIVHEMAASGVTVVVSTSYMDEAERFDRLAMIHRGHIIAVDTPQQLQRELEGRLVVIGVDRPREARAKAREHPAVGSATLFGESLHLLVGSAEADGPDIAAELRRAGFYVHSVQPVSPSLEDVFIERMAREAA